MSFAIVDADLAGARTVGYGDIGGAVPVEIADSDIAGGPFGIPESAARDEVSFAVVQEDNFGVGTVIADHNIHVAVPVQIGESSGIAAVGRIRKFGARREVSLAIAQEDHVLQGPVPTFGQHDIENPVAVYIPNAGVSAGFRHGLQRDSFEDSGRSCGPDGERAKKGRSKQTETIHTPTLVEWLPVL